jgi:Tfp pilus assembly protein PilN
MIEINLLSEELRVKTRAKGIERMGLAKIASFSREQLFIYAIPALLGLFVSVHILFAVIAIFKNAQLGFLNRRLLALAPQKKELDEFNKEYSLVSQDVGFIRLLTEKRILWTQKLNKLSLDLPPGIWFNEILINAKDLIIQGSVISLQKEEVNLINKLLDNLKADSKFSGDFTSLELTSVQKKNIGGYDIADFILTGALRLK